MSTQNFKNYAQFVPLFHYFSSPLCIAILALASINLYQDVTLLSSMFKDIPKISYNGYLNLISTSAPDFLFPLLMDYLNYSLYIEFGLIAAFIINEEKLQIRPERIAQLAAFIACSTHEFGAIVREINPTKKTKKSAYLEEIPVNFLEEQNLIAEQGISEFLENI